MLWSRTPASLIAASIATLALSAPAAAQSVSYGGGGVTVHTTQIPWQVPGQVGANSLGCIGGMGYRAKNGKRGGGEGHFCDGPYANMAMGGAHFGFQGKRGGFWLMGYNTVGAGWIGVHGVDTGRFDGMFVYTRPSFGAGLALGHWAAVEGNVFASLPLNILGVAGRDMDPQFTFPHVGLQATLLFGDFSRKRKQEPVPTYAPPPPPEHHTHGQPPRPPAPPAPPAAPEPPAAPSGPLRPGDLPPAGADDAPPPPPPRDSRPLAIPG